MFMMSLELNSNLCSKLRSFKLLERPSNISQEEASIDETIITAD